MFAPAPGSGTEPPAPCRFCLPVCAQADRGCRPVRPPQPASFPCGGAASCHGLVTRGWRRPLGVSIGSTSNSGERRGFPLLWGIYRALGDQTPDLISFRKSAGKGNSEAPPTRWRVLARGTRSGKALPVARPQQVALDMVCSPAAFLSDSNPEPGPSDRLIHHTQPCRKAGSQFPFYSEEAGARTGCGPVDTPAGGRRSCGRTGCRGVPILTPT